VTRRAIAWTLLAAAVAIAVAVVGVPVWLLQPFAPQTPQAVEWSWQLRRAAPAGTAVLAVLSLGLAGWLWRAPVARTVSMSTGRTAAIRGAVPRVALVLLVASSAGAAWFARQNHFEWMFRPFPDARFLAATDPHGVPATEPVIGVAGNGQALAFPITRIGYHHLVNTTLGDVPIVATY
jgi:hypothetical protein